jgi:hypothetical protein
MPLDLYFCLHVGEESFTEQFRELFTRADIIVLEQTAHDDSIDSAEEGVNALSRGEITPGQIDQHTQDGDLIATDRIYFRRLNEIIYQSQKRIYFERSPLGPEEIRRMSKYNVRGDSLSKHYLRDYLRDYEKHLSFVAACHRKRDKEFASQLAHLQRNSMGANILAIRGAAHQRILERFLGVAKVLFVSHLSDLRISLLMESTIISRRALGEEAEKRELLMALVQLFEIQESGDLSKIKLADIARTYDKVSMMSEGNLWARLHWRSLGSLSPVGLG